MKKLFLDGSNLLLGVTQTGVPSVHMLANIYDALTKKGYECFVIFDQSIPYLLEKKARLEERQLLISLIARSHGVFTLEPVADPHLLSKAAASGGTVVNHSDRYRTWTSAFPQGMPPVMNVSYSGGYLTFYSKAEPTETFSVELQDELILFELRIRSNSSVDDQPINGGNMRILPTENVDSSSTDARLIVFALDASASMWHPDDQNSRDSYDGEFKSKHVTKLLKDTMSRLTRSNVRSSIYISLLNFAGSVCIHQFDKAQMAHIDRTAKFIKADSFDYTAGVRGNGTSIGGALSAAVQLIDGALADPSNKELANDWHALIVLFTDGDENVMKPGALKELVADLSATRGILAEQCIRVASIGIGKHSNLPLLVNISSAPTNEQMNRFKKASQVDFLEKNQSNRPVLCLHVKEFNPKYQDVIRNFVDIASTTM